MIAVSATVTVDAVRLRARNLELVTVSRAL